MRKHGGIPSAYQAMWLFAMFDLPNKTKAERLGYTRFRKALLREGFSMFQYSVYGRYCGSQAYADQAKRRVKVWVPDNGEVRLLTVTERQFGKMEILVGRIVEKTEQPPDQLMLF